MSILGRADLARRMNDLDKELDSLYCAIVRREVVADAVGKVRSNCHECFLELDRYKRELQVSKSSADQALAQVISRLNNKFRAVREVLGPLIEVLEIAASSPNSSRRPSGFENRHGKAETAIEQIRLNIQEIANEFGGAAGLQEHSRRRHGDDGLPRYASNYEKSRHGYREPGAWEYSRRIS